MSTSTLPLECKCLHEKCDPPLPEIYELYAELRPMDQLPDQYRVTPSNPEPLLVHFAIPTNEIALYRYAAKQNLLSNPIKTVFTAIKCLAEYAQYELELCWPFEGTSECGLVLELYSNYTMNDKMLIEEDQEDVIRMVKEALELDESIRPRWYFDAEADLELE